MSGSVFEARICAACPVLQGECPNCGTFWVVMPGGKRHGLTPVQRQAFDGPTSHLFRREQLGNFIEKPVTEDEIAAARNRLVRRLVGSFADCFGYARKT